MAGYSVESLLTWMKDTSRLFGWDALMALSGDKVNGLLQGTYTAQLSQGITQHVPDGSIAIPETDVSYHFSDFILGPPILSFAQAGLGAAPLELRMAVVSGVQTTLQTVRGVSHILRLAAWEPASAPSLQMDLSLLEAAAALTLDLAKSENLLLVFPGTPTEQREAGKFFQAWLHNADNPGRLYPLSVFADQGNSFMTVRRIDVRSQREDADAAPAADNRGALLLFLTMEHGAMGAFPNEADLRFLIPNDPQPVYSGTALFSREVLYRAAFGQAVLQLLEGGEFDFSNTRAGAVQKMVARAGSFQVTAGAYQGTDLEFQSEPFSISAYSGEQPLTVEFEQDQASQRWQFLCTATFKYRSTGSTQWTTHTGAFEVSLRHEFQLTADDSAVRVMEGQLFVPYAHEHEVSAVSGLPDSLAPALLEQINGFIAYTIKRALLERYVQVLNIAASETFLEQWRMGSEQGLAPLRSALPKDLAVFGELGGGQDGLRIVEQGAVLAAGASLQFTTQPPRQGLSWSLENAPGSEGQPGVISDQGLYRAPPRHTLAQGVHRVLVIVRDGTQPAATALVTVQADSVSINPLIEVCNYSEQVTLSAGGLGSGALEWSIRNPVAGESGQLIADDPQGDHTYVAAGKVSGKTYVLDEIDVRDSLSGQGRSAWILVVQKPPLLEIRPEQGSSLPPGQIRLLALFDEDPMDQVRWSLGAGSPGSIDANGVYSSEPGALQRFALIFAEVDEGTHQYAGHLILPLPLSRSTDLLQLLARQ